MKYLLIFSIFLTSSIFGQNVGIGTNTPDASAKLDVTSANSGVLVPRIALTSTTDVTTITSPATSLLVYNTNAAITGGDGVGFYYYNGTQWIKLSTGATSEDWSITGNSGTNSSINFIGTTDYRDFNIRTTNNERISVKANGQIDITGDVINQELNGSKRTSAAVYHNSTGTQVSNTIYLNIQDGYGTLNSGVLVTGNFYVQSNLSSSVSPAEGSFRAVLQRSTNSAFTTPTDLETAYGTVLQRGSFGSFDPYCNISFSYVDNALSVGPHYYRIIIYPIVNNITGGYFLVSDIDLNVLQLKR